VLLDSPLCKGKERTGAADALKAAIASYNKARSAYAAANDSEIALVKTLQKIAEQVALAAAKIGRSCQGGQTALPLAGKAAPSATPAKATAKTPRKAGKDGKPAAGQPNAYMLWAIPRIAAILKGNKNMSRKDAMVQAGAEWQAKKAAGTAPTPKAPKAATPGKRAGARAATPAKAPKAPKAPKTPKARAPAGNAAKDAMILKAVKGSLKDLAAELRAGGV
jgi:hypothetical protein